MKKLEELISTYKDFPKKGINFKDVLEIIQEPEVFNELILKMSSSRILKKSEAIISIDARGFIFGSAIALQSCKPMIVARKPGKLPGELVTEKYKLEYGENSLSIQKNSLKKYNSYVIVDDLLATGGTAIACAELFTENFAVENSNILILGIIDLTSLGGSKLIMERNYKIETLIDY